MSTATNVHAKRGRGNVTWAVGSKYEYMCLFKSTYQALSEGKDIVGTGSISEYLDKITKLFFVRYPRTLPYDKDVDDPTTLIWPDDSMLSLYDEEINSLPPTEHEAHREVFKEHRKVCTRILHRFPFDDPFNTNREC